MLERHFRKLYNKPRKENISECPECKKSFHVAPSLVKNNKSKNKFCSMICKSIHMKKGKTQWGFKNEGCEKNNNPHKRIQVDKKRVYQHRHLMECKLGRKLLKTEHVHHINGNPHDNDLKNLTIVTSSEHGKIHKRRYKIPPKD